MLQYLINVLVRAARQVVSLAKGYLQSASLGKDKV